MTAALSLNQVSLRPVTLVLLLFAELMMVSFAFDAFSPGLTDSGQWFSFFGYAGRFAKILVAVVVFSILGLWPRLPEHFNTLNQSMIGYPYRYLLILQLISFALFVWCTATIFGSEVNIDEISSGLAVAWLITLSTTGGIWLLALAPWHYWRKLMLIEAKVIITALVVGVLAWVLASSAQTLWTPLSDLTFKFAAVLLGLIYPEIIVNPELKLLGARDFVVNIAPACSGYEGMGLMAIFTGFYLSIFRNDFRFPQALWLFPIGILTIWLFNNLRIAVLIAIGVSFSPAVAVGGFHSQAGWISFIAVIILTLMFCVRSFAF